MSFVLTHIKMFGNLMLNHLISSEEIDLLGSALSLLKTDSLEKVVYSYLGSFLVFF